MKNLYIPKGKSLHYEFLECQNIVNDGSLIVDNTIKARNVSGKGIVEANVISARHVGAMDIECTTLNAETLNAERVCAAEVILSGPAVVSCYLEAEYVETPKLTVAKSQVSTLKAGDVINLPEKKRGIVRSLMTGFFRRLWLSMTHRIPVDAAFTPAAEQEAPAQETQTDPSSFRADDQQAIQPLTLSDDLSNDFEFMRLMAMYRLLKDCGYTLRISPLAPTAVSQEEDAPVVSKLQEAA